MTETRSLGPEPLINTEIGKMHTCTEGYIEYKYTGKASKLNTVSCVTQKVCLIYTCISVWTLKCAYTAIHWTKIYDSLSRAFSELSITCAKSECSGKVANLCSLAWTFTVPIYFNALFGRCFKSKLIDLWIEICKVMKSLGGVWHCGRGRGRCSHTFHFSLIRYNIILIMNYYYQEWRRHTA